MRARIANAASNPYAQVALTYVRRPFASWFGGIMSLSVFFMLAGAVIMLIADHGAYHETPPAAEFLPFLLAGFFLFMSLATHMKDQFADSRAYLTPGFRRVHVIVAVAAILACVVLLPAAITLIEGWHSVGLVALAILLFGVVLWGIVTNSSAGHFLILPAFIALMMEPARVAVQQLLSGEYETLAVFLLCVGAAISWRGMLRLVRLTEDEPESYRRIQWDRSGRLQMTGQAPAAGGPLQQRLRNWAMDRDMGTLTRHARNAPVSWWSRVCRWQLGMVTPSSFWSLCIFILVCFQIMAWLMPDVLRPAKRGAFAPTAIMMLMMLMIPAFTLFGQLAARWPMLGRGLLLPVERRAYVRQLGLAAALSHFWFWAGITAAVALWWLVNVQQPLQSGVFAGILLFSAVTQVWIFGVVVWSASFRSRGLAFTATIVAFVGVQLVGSICLASPKPLPESALILAGAILAVVGTLLVWRGYRRWLVADLD